MALNAAQLGGCVARSEQPRMPSVRESEDLGNCTRAAGTSASCKGLIKRPIGAKYSGGNSVFVNIVNPRCENEKDLV